MSKRTDRATDGSALRYGGEWMVEITKDGRRNAPSRKVVTERETLRYQLKQFGGIMDDLRAGHEVRLAFGGMDCVRLFPLMDTKCESMKVVAETMGDFRNCLKDIRPKLFRVTRSEAREVGKRDVAALAEEARDRRRERVWVTPDAMVECPRCGFAFRVGRRLAG